MVETETHDHRPELALAALMIVALVLVLYDGKIGQLLAVHIGLSDVFMVAWKVLQWPLSFAATFLSFSIIYYFGPDLDERKWYWVTPGAVGGVALWLLASLGFRLYLHFFNSYSATYGSLGAVIVLMLWLYITGFTVLIGRRSELGHRERRQKDCGVRGQETRDRAADEGGIMCV